MANISQYTAPATNEYAGDEVSALVLDPGSNTTRAGFAGEDVPKSIVPTHYIISASKGTQYGEAWLDTVLPDAEVQNPYNADGLVENWDAASKLWQWSITSRLTGPKQKVEFPESAQDDMDVDQKEEEDRPMAQNPLLMSEPGWQSAKGREKCAEIALDEWGVPAFYLAQSGVLAAFSAGKPTALVVDIGASVTSVTPVVDGMVLRKAVTRSPLAGNFLSDQARILFAKSQPMVPLTPYYMIKSKTAVDAGTPSQAIYHKFAKPPTDSFRRYQEDRVITSFKESVVQVWDNVGHHRLAGLNPQGVPNEEVAKQIPGRSFEMPDGWNQVFTVDRYKVAEGLFDAAAAQTDPQHPAPKPEQTIPAIISASLATLGDPELVPQLLNNIVIVGSSSLLMGFNKRLQLELEAKYPGPKVRIFAAGPIVERKYASWIGGSILGSLGSFHQLWVSKKEWEEHGPSIIEKRCK